MGAVAMRWLTIRARTTWSAPSNGSERSLSRRRVATLRAEALELQGCVVGHRRLDVGDDRQVVVVDVDQLGRVDGLGAGLGDDQGDRVADEPDLVVGQRPARALVVDVRERLQAAGPEVLGRVDGQHARGLLGLGRVDRAERGVRRTGCARTPRARRRRPAWLSTKVPSPTSSSRSSTRRTCVPSSDPGMSAAYDRTGGSLRDGAPRRPEPVGAPL